MTFEIVATFAGGGNHLPAQGLTTAAQPFLQQELSLK